MRIHVPLPLLVATAMSIACSPFVPPEARVESPRTGSVSAIAPPTEARVEVSLAGPSRVLYSPATMRAPRPAVRITITNPSSQPLDVTDLRVHLEVTRGNQRVRCEDAAADDVARKREPQWLAAGASATWIRSVDCPLALAGSYVVQVVVAFGRTEPNSNGAVTRELAITVTAPPDAQPRPVAAVPGLYAAIGSGGLVPSTKAAGRIVVAFVNGSSESVALPAMRLALRVRRVGTDIPCEDEPTLLRLPAALPANAVLTRPVDVSCLGLGVTGTSDVDARLLIGEEAFSIGTLRIDVSTDPSHRNRRLLP